MKKERVIQCIKCIDALEKDTVIDIVRILYDAANDINCLGVVFKRFDNLDARILKVETNEAEPLHAYDGEEEEGVFFTYFASVVEDTLPMTDRQLKEVLNIMQQLELVQRFALKKHADKEGYLLELQKDTRADFEKSEQICAYAIMSDAIDMLKEYIE